MLSKRVQNLKPSATLALAAKAKELKAQGKDVISLSVGEPDWDTFAGIKEAGINAIKEGQTKYTPASGLPELRAAICQQTNEDLGTQYDPKQVTVSTGGKFVIFSALQAVIDPGDEVIIPAPYWVSYPTMVELAGGTPVIAESNEDTNYKITAEGLKKYLTAKTKLLILNSPSNPTGAMYSADELKQLGQVLLDHPNVLVMCDDIYNRLVFSDSGLAPHLLQQIPELTSRTMIINGVAKTYSMTGWRVGWGVGPEQWVGAMNKYQSQSVSCACNFSQRAALYAVEKSQQDVANAVVELKKRRDFVFELLNQLPNINAKSPDGAFYIWPNVSAYLGKTWNGKKLETTRDLAEGLLVEQSVAAVPGIEFGAEGYLRISYALNNDRMKEAVNRISQFLTGLN